jgi:hypothetical protein
MGWPAATVTPGERGRPRRGSGDEVVGCGQPGGPVACRVGGCGERGGGVGAVEHGHGHARGGEPAGQFVGAASQRLRGNLGRVGVVQDDEDLAGQHVPPPGKVGQEGGVLAGGGLQRRVRQSRCGVGERGDRGAQVGPLGADHDLHGTGDGVEAAPERGDQRLLLAVGAQPEVQRRRLAHQRSPVPTEVDHAVGVEAARGEGQRRRRRPVVGTSEPRRRRVDAFRCQDPAAGGAVLAPGGEGEAVGWQPVAATERQQPGTRDDRQGQAGEHRQRQQAAGRQVHPPHDDGGHGEDGQLPSRQAGQDLVGPVDVGGDPHPRWAHQASTALAALAETTYLTVRTTLPPPRPVNTVRPAQLGMRNSTHSRHTTTSIHFVPAPLAVLFVVVTLALASWAAAILGRRRVAAATLIATLVVVATAPALRGLRGATPTTLRELRASPQLALYCSTPRFDLCHSAPR